MRGVASSRRSFTPMLQPGVLHDIDRDRIPNASRVSSRPGEAKRLGSRPTAVVAADLEGCTYVRPAGQFVSLRPACCSFLLPDESGGTSANLR